MNIHFNNILIPIDFSVSTDVAIQKALSLCTEPDVCIHLLHVFTPSMDRVRLTRIFSGTSLDEQIQIERNIKQKTDAVANAIRTMRQNIVVLTWVSYGQVEKAISAKARELNVDLIIIGKNSHHYMMPFLSSVIPSRLAKSTGIAVLTVKPGALNQPIKTVVIPVEEELSEKKIAMIEAFRLKNWIQICLVAFSHGNDIPSILPMSLLNAYRRLKNGPGNEVSCKVLHGSNRAKSILKYCKEVDADLLIATPEVETKIGWMNKHISDVLPVESKTQVLAVS